MPNMRLDHLAARRHRPAVRLTLRVCLVQAYPDMLEVGRLPGGLNASRTHFSAWVRKTAFFLSAFPMFVPSLSWQVVIWFDQI